MPKNNSMPIKYNNMTTKYANNSAIRVSSADISLLFRVSSLDDDGKEVMDTHTNIIMTPEHFEAFVKNCNTALEMSKDKNKNESK